MKTEINKKTFFMNQGKTFDEFVKHVEATKNNQSGQEQTEEAVHNMVKGIRKKIDKADGWKKLKG